MRFSDEVLMAYADGELDLVTRAEIEAAMAAEPDVARAVGRHKALRDKLQAAYAGVLEEPVPAALQAAIAPAPAPVIDLAARRAAAIPTVATAARHWGVPEWGAMAASVTVGLMVGLFALRPAGSPFAEQDGVMVARAGLATALEQQLAVAGNDESIRIGLSFRDRAGEYCRTFVIRGDRPRAGMACRDDANWRVDVLAAAIVPEHGELRTASASLPSAVLQAIDDAIDGEPLDAAAEAAAREAGWRAPAR